MECTILCIIKTNHFNILNILVDLTLILSNFPTLTIIADLIVVHILIRKAVDNICHHFSFSNRLLRNAFYIALEVYLNS